MSTTVSCSIDLESPGKSTGYLKIGDSTNQSGWATYMVPIIKYKMVKVQLCWCSLVTTAMSMKGNSQRETSQTISTLMKSPDESSSSRVFRNQQRKLVPGYGPMAPISIASSWK